MAAGIAVVAADVGRVKEIAVDGVTGFIANPRKPEILAEKLR